MTTTPETPALPGDLTDETIERAKFRVDSVHHIHGTECLCGFSSHRSRSRTEHITEALVAELAAARVAPVTPSVGELEQALGFPLADGQEPTEGHRAFCHEHGHAADRSRFPSPRCARCGEERAPSPDRGKLIAEARKTFRIFEDERTRYGAGPARYERSHEIDLIGRLADALAVPPVVNEAKLTEIIGEHTLDRYDTDTDLEVCACSVATEGHDAHVAAVLVERQHEWQGKGR